MQCLENQRLIEYVCMNQHNIKHGKISEELCRDDARQREAEKAYFEGKF